MADTVADASQPWYRSLNATQWKTLFASNLGWMFDGYETFALILTVGVALRSLLDPSLYPQIPAYAGTVIAITLLGWGVGGLIGGILKDYIGCRRMMIYAILAYSLMTGLSALAWDWMSFAALRLLVGVAIGSKWSTGASMTAEVWPNHAWWKGAGLMHAASASVFFLASLVWLFVGAMGPGWRIMFLLGILPAFVALWIRVGVPESAMWEATDQQRRAALDRQKSGAVLAEHEHKLTRFTVVELFADPALLWKVTIVVFLMSPTTTPAWWGISTWVPYIASVAAKAGLTAQQWASYAAMAYNAGAILGYGSFGFLADAFGRKPVVIVFFVMSSSSRRSCSCGPTI